MAKKIGILTINDDLNYGNRLQNYALQVFLNQNGYEAETIKNIKKDRMLVIKKVIKKFLPFKKYKKYNNFMRFDKKIKYSRQKIYDGNIPSDINSRYDAFVSGSDQVWNYNFSRMSDVDFLTFADKRKRNSFSASFGVSEIPNERKEFYKKNLLNMNNISVRENNAKKIVEDLTGRNDVEILMDPTLLITREKWGEVTRKIKKLPAKYILLYFLGELSEERRSVIQNFAKENDCEIVDILDRKGPYFVSGPEEFVYLEKNAFFICTDSFHSSVFSIIFEKPFIVFDREDKQAKMNSRLDTLLEKFEFKDRWYAGCLNKDVLNINYENKSKILEFERVKAKKFLKRIENK